MLQELDHLSMLTKLEQTLVNLAVINTLVEELAPNNKPRDNEVKDIVEIREQKVLDHLHKVDLEDKNIKNNLEFIFLVG